MRQINIIILTFAALVLLANVGMTQTVWVKYSGNPVLNLGASDTWDDYHVYEPTILLDGTTYKMWYTGEDGSDQPRIGYATSSDGITWAKYNKPGTGYVLPLGDSGEWDDYHVYHPTVLYDGTQYKMWYSGYDGSNVRIGYATSTNGIDWTKYDNNPVLNLGASGTWDDDVVHSPTALYDGTDYKMWYSGNNGSNLKIGYATTFHISADCTTGNFKDSFSPGESVCGKTTIEIIPDGTYDYYIVVTQEWTIGDNQAIPTDGDRKVEGLNEIIVSGGSGNIPLTTLWPNPHPSETAQYDIIVDINDDGDYD